jgi:hypothetical protein
MGRADDFFEAKLNSKEASGARWSFSLPVALDTCLAIAAFTLFLIEVYCPGASEVAASSSRTSTGRGNDDDTENVFHSKVRAWESALSTREGSAESSPWQMKHSSPQPAARVAPSGKSLCEQPGHKAYFSTVKLAQRRVY